MDSGPVATFQVHEYLRPKVWFLSSERDEINHVVSAVSELIMPLWHSLIVSAV